MSFICKRCGKSIRGAAEVDHDVWHSQQDEWGSDEPERDADWQRERAEADAEAWETR